MASWDGTASIATLLTLEDITNTTVLLAETAIANSTNFTPVLKLAGDARLKGYDTVCLPLTTEKWKKRWTEMCLLPPSSMQDASGTADMGVERQAEAWRARPCFEQDEVTITRLGG